MQCIAHVASDAVDGTAHQQNQQNQQNSWTPALSPASTLQMTSPKIWTCKTRKFCAESKQLAPQAIQLLAQSTQGRLNTTQASSELHQCWRATTAAAAVQCTSATAQLWY
jgi:hypothetical protein